MSDEEQKVFDWITNRETGLVRKRDNLFSTVCVVITNDSKRIGELKEYVAQNGILQGTGDKENIYEFDDWNLLWKLYPDKQPQKVKLNDGGMAGLTGGGADMDMAYKPMLRHIESDLKSKPTIVMIHGLIHPNPDLNRALNSWAFDNAVMQKNSTIVVVIPSKTVKLAGQVVELISSEILKKCNVIEVEPSTKTERRETIVFMAKDMNIGIDSEEIDRLVDITAGLDLNQLESTLVETIFLHNAFKHSHISKAKGKLISENSPIKVKMNGSFGFERIGGYRPHKDFIKRRIIDVLKNSERAKEYGVSVPKGVLVFGMAGTGKTVFAEALAKELAIPFVQITPKDISSKWYGESEQKMSDILKTIEALEPCLVYIDEIDAIGRDRSDGGDHEASRKVMSELMQWLGKERNSLVWATTNRVEQIDEALLRVGRFDFKIPQLLPDVEARKEILKVHLETVRKIKHNLTDEDMVEIAEKTELWQGAELENLVKIASNNVFAKAIEDGAKNIVPLTKDDLVNTLKDIQVNTAERKQTQDDYLKLAEQYVNDRTFLIDMTETYNKPMSRLEQAKERREKAKGKK